MSIASTGRKFTAEALEKRSKSMKAYWKKIKENNL